MKEICRLVFHIMICFYMAHFGDFGSIIFSIKSIFGLSLIRIFNEFSFSLL